MHPTRLDDRTIKEATVNAIYETHDQQRQRLADFVAAYKYARRLKSLRGLTPYETHLQGMDG